MLERHLQQVRDKTEALNVPLIVAGDIFHKWDVAPEVISLGVRYFKDAFTVYGQHDTPHHHDASIDVSAYKTCVEAGMQDLDLPTVIEVSGLRIVLHPFPWGRPITPPEGDADIHIAVCHKGIYLDHDCPEWAEEDAKVSGLKTALKGYTFAVFGDNHIPFQTRISRCSVVNCGGMVPTNIDQKGTETAFYVLYSDGTVETCPYDLSQDRWIEIVQSEDDGEDITPAGASRLLAVLSSLRAHGRNYVEAVRHSVERSRGIVREPVLEYMLEVTERCE